ncbi:adaptin N terminal region-domain-containing protein [Paraphysoderma sedebokerense]|nr:adaptin N terminal region-domain-containing protein [Paraphysoderma sedebokerense]
MASDPCYTIIRQSDSLDTPTLDQFKASLEKGTDDSKIETMKKVLVGMLNGDPNHQLLMHVIRFVMPSKNKILKKLVHMYWEVCPKTNPDGKLKQEMILVCNALRNDLQHPNEYIRGATLRLLCRLKEAEILEPLIPSCRASLEHRHPYVRKNAILAIYSIFKHSDFLIPDAPDLVANFLVNETDLPCKRNAFVMLQNTAPDKAIAYLNKVFPQIPTFDEHLQLVVIELIRKECKNNPNEKARYVKMIYALLQAPSSSVKYEAASSLMTLTANPSAVKAAATCYIELILKESDNNVKLIVLDRLNELREKHERVLDDLVMDMLRVLTSPDIEVRRKCLKISMELVSSRNVDDVVSFLKKELQKTHEGEYEKMSEYRQLLIQSIHSCAIKYPEVAATIVHVLMEFLGDSSSAPAVDVIAFVREVVEKFPHLRSGIISKLLESFSEMRSGKVIRGALWIIGEYCLDQSSIEKSLNPIRKSLGEIPILASEQRVHEEAANVNGVDGQPSSQQPASKSPTSSARRVLADGTYASESAYTSTKSPTSPKGDGKKPPIRALLLNGDFYTGSVLATTFTKLTLRYTSLTPQPPPSSINSLVAEAMLIMTSILRIGQSQYPAAPIDENSMDHILGCLKTLTAMAGNEERVEIEEVKKAYLVECRSAFSRMLSGQEAKLQAKKNLNKKQVQIQADDLISFRLLKNKKNADGDLDEYELDLTRATGVADRAENTSSALSRIVQLTGFSDPVYAEAYVNVHQFDILLDVLIVNQTSETLQNLVLEFATLGDLKLVERPTPVNLAPHSFHTIKANIKVSSTETGVIFGNIVYDGPGLETTCVILNDIHIDIMDYIHPATCTETQFRSMWTEFEWENKVNVNTNIKELREYLNHILKSTNMTCLTPEHALEGDCGVLAANMYARSVFGEDALANICIEKQGSGPVTGHIRIRSKTQGIALSLGDKITLSQKVQLNATGAASA